MRINRWKNRLAILPLLLPLVSLSQQTYQLAGTVLGSRDSLSIPGAVIILANQSDTTKKTGAAANAEGLFIVNALHEGKYNMKISFLGYRTYQREITIKQNTVLPAIFLSPDAKQLSEVSVTGVATPVQIKGDTIQYNADAYKVHPDASAEDLIKKMPGVTTDGNTLKVNGEEVKKILVDGKPFFSDDPTATLRNLPADVVGNMQVFDKQSDQAEFTGFKDGNAEKTINLNTKKGMNVGRFGKVYGGYGTDGKYNSGFTFNSFNGARRISLLGMSNNINQQNFNISDIMSLMSNSGTQSMGPPGSGSGADFFTGQQNGITTTHALGLNYNDSWGKKVNVSGSYFVNYTDNKNTSSILRNYYTADRLKYQQNSSSETKNLNHKINLKLEYWIDSMNKITATPRLTFQSNKSTNNLTGRTWSEERNLSTLANTTFYEASAYNFNNDLLYQHKFRKNRRTVSLNVNTQLYNNSGNGSYYSSTLYNDTALISEIIDQEYTTDGTSRILGANLSYTEPMGKSSMLLFSYKPSVTTNYADRTVNNPGADGNYTQNDPGLSNTFESNYYVQQGGVNYSVNKGRSVLTLGADAQQAELKAEQTYSQTLKRQQSFFNVLPSVFYTYKSTKNFNMNLNYRTSTTSPSISQLQNIIDKSNSLFIRSGNPDLKQSYESNVTVRLMKRLPEKERHFIVFVRAAQTNDYIGNSTTILNNDTVVQNVSLERGSQYIKPVNLNNYYNINSFGAFGFPIKVIKSNFNVNAGYGLTNTPALINNRLNYALNHSIKGGFYLSSNISQNLDFSLSYNGSYNTVSNSLQTQSNTNYLNHSFTAKANYILSNRLVLNSDVTEYAYTGLSSGFNQTYTLWNASLAYKFMKNRALEMKVSAYDLLNQNRSISRTITETYTEDSQTKVLNRYFLVTLTYTFKRFKNNAVGPQEMKLPKDLPPPENMPLPPMGR